MIKVILGVQMNTMHGKNQDIQQYKMDSNINQIIDFIYEKQKSKQTCYRLCPTEYEEISAFINRILDKNQYPDDFILVSYDDKNINAVACFSVEKDDKYFECIGGFFDCYADFSGILERLRTDYRDFMLDFVIRPENVLLEKWLRESGAIFDETEYCYRIEKHHFILNEPSNLRVTELDNKETDYIQQYFQIHNDNERYWTAARVLAAPDIFKIFALIENNKLVGYVDIACKSDPAEIYDLKIFNTDNNKMLCNYLLKTALTKIFANENIKSLIVHIGESNTKDIEILNEIDGILYDRSRNVRILL
jgi:hypothetical protein